MHGSRVSRGNWLCSGQLLGPSTFSTTGSQSISAGHDMFDRQHLPSRSKQFVHGQVVKEALRACLLVHRSSLPSARPRPAPKFQSCVEFILHKSSHLTRRTARMRSKISSPATKGVQRQARDHCPCAAFLDRKRPPHISLHDACRGNSQAYGYRAGGREVESGGVHAALARDRIVTQITSDLQYGCKPDSFEQQRQPAVEPGSETHGLIQTRAVRRRLIVTAPSDAARSPECAASPSRAGIRCLPGRLPNRWLAHSRLRRSTPPPPSAKSGKRTAG